MTSENEQVPAGTVEKGGDELTAVLREQFPAAEFTTQDDPMRTDVVSVTRDDYPDVVATLVESGFHTFADLCGVDYLRRSPRFEVVTTLLSHSMRRRVRVRVGVEAGDPTLPSITSLLPGANFYEREAFDLFGIVFEGHPDLTRILMPDDWQGHPLQKDFAVGSVPVQFKESHKAP